MTAPRTGEPPLDQPYPGAPFGAALLRFWKKGLTFSGRASRSEFWKAWGAIYGVIVAIYLLAVIVAAAASSSYDSGGLIFAGFLNIVVLLVALATAIPGIALFVRRLHDGNRSGALYFLGLIPFVGAFILLVFMLTESDPRGAQYDLPGGARPSGGGYGAPHSGYTPGLPPAFAQGGPAFAPVPPPPAPQYAPTFAPVPTPPTSSAAGYAPVPPPPAPPTASSFAPVPPPPAPPTASPFAPVPPPPPAVAPSAPESFVPEASAAPAYTPQASAAVPPPPAPPTAAAPIVSGVPGGASASSSFVQPAASDDDLDATRASVPSSPSTWVLRLPDGRRLPVEGTIFIGRDPVGDPTATHAVLVPVDDPLKSMSKTHARIDATAGLLTVTDLHSTNGTTVRDAAGATIALTPGVARGVASDGQVLFGDYVAELGRNAQ
ncbi:DUF805 domain-containing protein [Microbacterium sp. BWT-B31]|uniref:DUF805 domain-containing protein n=1 Tax=Microbacterium sp. BWT-B31 TaxID=3232072 RepID=UPI0035274089